MGIKLGDLSPLAGALTGKGMFGKGLAKLGDSGLGALVPISLLAASQRKKVLSRQEAATEEEAAAEARMRGSRVGGSPIRGENPSEFKSGGKVKKRAKGGSAVAAVHKHERNMHKGKPLTKMAKGGKVTRGDGIAKKGHTKGKMV